MINDYNQVQSLTKEEFNKLAPKEGDLRDKSKYTKSDNEDIRKMESLLDVREKTLNGNYYLEHRKCKCGRMLTMYDFVFTGLVDATHSKSFILHTFLGTKYVMNNRARVLRCSACGTTTARSFIYFSSHYSCYLREDSPIATA